jgi:hypothetical protein
MEELMDDPICTINCAWNASGKVTATVTSGSFGDAVTDSLSLFSPSIPMLVSQQLGTFLPATGLLLTSNFINCVISGQQVILPINSAIKGVMLDFIRRSQGGVAIQFKPEANLFAKSQDVEDGSKQFVHNYTISVFEKLPYYNLIICKIFLGLSLQAYLEFLEKQIKSGKLDSNNLNWNSDFSIYMTKVSIDASISYKTGTPEGYNKEAEINTLGFYAELSEKYKEICRLLGLDREF